MKLIDWIAILGALAWTPHLVNLVREWLAKSKVRVITQREVEIGFTTYGPIFNIRLAFSVENRGHKKGTLPFYNSWHVTNTTLLILKRVASPF